MDTGINVYQDVHHPGKKVIEYRLKNEWSLSSLYNFRLLKEFLEIYPEALKEIASSYENDYGISKSQSIDAARQSLDTLIIKPFYFYPDISPDNLPSNPLSDDWVRARIESIDKKNFSERDFDQAILIGEPKEFIQETLEHSPELATKNVPGTWPLEMTGEPPLFFALERPEIVELLIQKGANINAANEFGKTALMYAVQFNLIETTKTLLKHNPDLEMGTKDIWNCSYAITISGRTALMYAAEAASLNEIELLVKAGANISAKDSAGHTAFDYLADNVTLESKERLEAKNLLQPQ